MAHNMLVGLLLLLVLSAPPSPAAEPDLERGEATFQKTCTVCHYPDRTEKKLGPGLKGLFEKKTLANGEEMTVENVTAGIEAGGNGMPPYKGLLSGVDMSNLLAYLQSL